MKKLDQYLEKLSDTLRDIISIASQPHEEQLYMKIAGICAETIEEIKEVRVINVSR
jgi:hypothetical protein